MLHILLLILKIIGIFLLTIIGLFLLLILLILFVPIRYEAEGECKGTLDSLKINAKISYLLKLFTLTIQYEEKQLIWRARIVLKNISSEVGETEKAEDFSEETEIKETEQKVSISPELRGAEQKVVSESEKNIPQKTVKEKAEISQEKEKAGLSDKLEIVIEKLKCTFTKICGMINSIREKSEEVLRFLNDEQHKAAFQKFLLELKKFLKKIKPKKLSGTITFGFEDPSLTGKVLGGISLFYPYIQNNLIINTYFEEKTLYGDFYIKGRIRISMLLTFLLNLVISKNVRITISHILELKKKLKQEEK